MPKRHRDEVILARWLVGPAHLRVFTQRVRAHYREFPPVDLLAACEQAPTSGLEVVCRDDAVFAGSWGLAFLYNNISDIRLADDCILFVMDDGAYDVPVPVGPEGRAEAARIVEYYVRKGREDARLSWEARQAPTWSNRLLTVAENHFVWVVLGLFFVVIPLLVLAVSLLRGAR